MQMKYDSASVGRLALPIPREYTPAQPAASRPVKFANPMLADRAIVVGGKTWETAAWVILLASTWVAIGLSFLI
jgi:hypothetical protein